MSNDWQEVYSELAGFIIKHPELKIEESIVRIPENFRLEFYQLFDSVRKTFLEEKFSNLLNEATALSRSYLKVEQEVAGTLGLDDILTTVSLHRFLHNPIDELRRVVFDPLFDLLKAKVGVEVFTERASQNIKDSFGLLYQSGYEKWLALSLVQLLEADKLFQVIIRPVPYLQPEDAVTEITKSDREVPTPEESKCLLFKYKCDGFFVVPDCIVHSTRINQYLAFKSEIGKAFVNASNASEEREWYSLHSIGGLEPGLILIYVDDQPEDIALVTDAQKICRPDLIIACKYQKDWYNNEGLASIKVMHDSLKPILGTYIVSKEPVPGQEYQKQDADVHILTVGFDQAKLEPIVRALMQTENK